MVHGGGHHAVSGAGGGGGQATTSSSWFHGGGQHSYGSSNVASSNVIFINNQQRSGGYWYSSSPWWNAISPPPRQSRWTPHVNDSASSSSQRSMERDCDECCENACEACCHAICLCLCCSECCSSWRRVTRTVDTRTRNDDFALSRPRERRRWSYIFPSFIVSAVLYVVLISLSEVRFNKITLNSGETRRIHKPALGRALQVSSIGGNGIFTYEIAGNECPPLSGPGIVLEDKLSLHLARDDYQYDYFYLNTGSLIELEVTQITGSSNIYILRGRNVLQRIVHDHSRDEVGGFAKDALLSRFVSAGSPGQLTLSYKTDREDTFILVYDNASTADGELQVHYTVTESTYDLRHVPPSCLNTSPVCVFAHSTGPSCLLLQAADTGSHTAQDVVDVRISADRRWPSIIIYSVAPMLVQIIVVCCRRKRRRENYTLVADSDYTEQYYSTTGVPTSPIAPSAPVEAQAALVSANDSEVPVMVADVVQIPTPIPVKGTW